LRQELENLWALFSAVLLTIGNIFPITKSRKALSNFVIIGIIGFIIILGVVFIIVLVVLPSGVTTTTVIS
jgi:hypothetical protein